MRKWDIALYLKRTTLNVYVKIFDKDTNEFYGTFVLDRDERGLRWLIQFWESDAHTHIKKDRGEGCNMMPFFSDEGIFLSFNFKPEDLL